MGYRFWWTYVMVLLPGVGVAALLLLGLFGAPWPTVVVGEIAVAVALLGILAWYRGTDALTESPREILEYVEEDEEADEGERVVDRPLMLRPGELTAQELEARFDRKDGNRTDP